MKYLDAVVTFREFPDEISLCVNISGCRFHCNGCHSPELWEDVGTVLSLTEIENLIENNFGITCFGFMGGDAEIHLLNQFANYIKVKYPNLKVGWYSGNSKLGANIDTKNFDYIKLGPYIKELGGLDNSNTNQRMYQYFPYFSDCTELGIGWKDITYKFWSNENNN